VPWPAASTIGDLLRREGLSQRRRRRAEPVSRPFLAATAPNEVWCADFKGWFRTADGQRCDPLTISDAHSRFLLACRITAPTSDGVRPLFERVLEEFGLPRASAPTTVRPVPPASRAWWYAGSSSASGSNISSPALSSRTAATNACTGH
jgi:transposase InsO family protein